ncbi:iron-sulfur cluster co-chaperone protein HscB isoform X3 [Nannospalax galili]|uniref:iron-sulfur cluster co-chaperone protein HscB isoform X3 n=1 Tax=Nannospalax galili TaxID=1026970 RepID=UPI0004ED097B|nr:iron-sulfur cluster co-chaperone protein HscB isoform X3 [Nannospalax galili]
MGVPAGRGPRKEAPKLRRRLAGGKRCAAMLALRRRRGPRAGERILLPALRRAATSGPYSRLLQPHGLFPSSNRSFSVDIGKLQHRYQQLQRLVHPDFFSQKSQTEKDFSEKHSTLVNDAYKTLQAPLSRGLYLLKLQGIEIRESTDYETDSQFLMEIMEINEKLAETQNEAAMEEIESTVRAKQKEFTDNVNSAFEQGDFEKAKEILTKMKYFSNLEEKIKLNKISL